MDDEGVIFFFFVRTGGGITTPAAETFLYLILEIFFILFGYVYFCCLCSLFARGTIPILWNDGWGVLAVFSYGKGSMDWNENS